MGELEEGRLSPLLGKASENEPWLGISAERVRQRIKELKSDPDALLQVWHKVAHIQCLHFDEPLCDIEALPLDDGRLLVLIIMGERIINVLAGLTGEVPVTIEDYGNRE